MKKVLIVGAGILGTSVAYHLSKEDVEITLIDRSEKGQATGAAAGIICPWLSQRRNKAWYTLANNGAHYYPTLISELEQQGELETGYKQVGALCLHGDKDKLTAMKERAEKRRVNAPLIGEITFLTEQEAKQRFPLLSDGYHVLYVSGAARVDGKQLTEAMLRVAMHRGVKYIEGSAELHVEDGKLNGVKVANTNIEADEVIICAGAWSNQLLHPLNINVDVSYQKAQIIHLQTNEQKQTNDWPVIMPPNDQYLLAFADQKIVIGATHENDVKDYDLSPTVAGMQDIMHKGITAASGISNCKFTEVKVGFRPYTANFLPVFGCTSEYENLWVANGLGSSGLTAGPYIGKELAKLIVGKDSELDTVQYRLELAKRKDKQ